MDRPAHGNEIGRFVYGARPATPTNRSAGSVVWGQCGRSLLADTENIFWSDNLEDVNKNKQRY